MADRKLTVKSHYGVTNKHSSLSVVTDESCPGPWEAPTVLRPAPAGHLVPGNIIPHSGEEDAANHMAPR